MKNDMDKIIFESRTEINNIINALDTYAEEHVKNEDVQKLKNLLEVMCMNW